MMGGIDEDAEWLALLFVVLAVPFVVAAAVTAIDLVTRSRRIVDGEPRTLDIGVVATAGLAAVIVAVIWGGWWATFVVLVAVLSARLVDVVIDADLGRFGRHLGAVFARRAVLLGLVVGIVAALARR